jgi:multiple sugar transport system ATP-binding protein
MVGIDKAEQDRRIANASKVLNLTHYIDRRPRQMSGGQRQRVAIGRAIVREPATSLSDEPLSSLDAALRFGMRLEISELHKRLATTMVYVTHDQVEAMAMGDKFVVLRSGSIEHVGSPPELYRKPKNLFVAGFIGSPKMNLISGPEAAKHNATTIGIRPEHISVSATEGMWKVRVGVSEHLGSDSLYYVHYTGLVAEMTVR